MFLVNCIKYISIVRLVYEAEMGVNLKPVWKFSEKSHLGSIWINNDQYGNIHQQRGLANQKKRDGDAIYWAIQPTIRLVWVQWLGSREHFDQKSCVASKCQQSVYRNHYTQTQTHTMGKTWLVFCDHKIWGTSSSNGKYPLVPRSY